MRQKQQRRCAATLASLMLALALAVGLLPITSYAEGLGDESSMPLQSSGLTTSLVEEEKITDEEQDSSLVETDSSELEEQEEPVANRAGLAAPLSAAIVTIDSSTPDVTAQLQAALDRVVAGEDITVRFDDSLGGQVTLEAPLTATGAMPNDATLAFSASAGFVIKVDFTNTNRRHFVFSQTGSRLTLDLGGVSLRGGEVGTTNMSLYLSGGIETNAAKLTVQNGTIEQCLGDYGGAMELKSASQVELYSLIIQDSRAWNEAGGLIARSGTLHMENCEVLNNVAQTNTSGIQSSSAVTTLVNVNVRGGQVQATTSGRGGSVTAIGASFSMEGGSISGNKAQTAAGLMNRNIASDITLTNVTIEGNESVQATAMYVDSAMVDTVVTLNGAKILNNTATTGTTAGIYSSGTTIVNAGTVFRGNRTLAGSGGALSTTSGRVNNVTIPAKPLQIRGTAENPVVFDQNTSAGGGAAINTISSDVTIEHTQFTGNTSAGNGGAMYISSATGTLRLKNSTVQSNTGASGGGLYLNVANAEFENTTIDGNKASASTGGGVYSALANATLSFTGGSVSGNEVGTALAELASPDNLGGGLYLNNGTSVDFLGTEVEDNTAYFGGGVYLTGNASMTMRGGSLSGNTATNKTTGTAGMGGGVYAESGALEFDGTQLAGNTAGVAGGAVLSSSGSVLLKGDTLVRGNVSRGFGAGGIEHAGSDAASYTRIEVEEDVVFSGNVSSSGISMPTADLISAHSTHVQATQFSYGLPYGYNNLDIACTSGTAMTFYTLTFDVGSGTLANAPAPTPMPAGAKLTFPGEPTHATLEFVGWYTDADPEIGTLWNFETMEMPDDNLTLYAVYLPVMYDIIYDHNDGQGTRSYGQARAGSLVEKPANPTWAGHRFLYWERGGAEWDFGSMTMPENDITLTARWETIATSSSSSTTTSRPTTTSSTPPPEPETSSSSSSAPRPSTSRPASSSSTPSSSVPVVPGGVSSAAPSSSAAPPSTVAQSAPESVPEESGGVWQAFVGAVTPLAGLVAVGDSWSMLNVLLTVVMLCASIYFIIAGRRYRGDKSASRLNLIAILVGVVAVPVMVLTQDFSKPIGFADVWSILDVLMVAGQCAAFVLARRAFGRGPGYEDIE